MPYGIGFTYMIIVQILFFIFTIGLVLWFVKNTKQKEIQTPKDILNKRLVSGEITKKEYNSMLKMIMNKGYKNENNFFGNYTYFDCTYWMCI